MFQGIREPGIITAEAPNRVEMGSWVVGRTKGPER